MGTGMQRFQVIPLSLNATKFGVLEEFFDEEPFYIGVSSDAGWPFPERRTLPRNNQSENRRLYYDTIYELTTP